MGTATDAPKTGGWISRPVDPLHVPTGGAEGANAKDLAHPFRDIVLVNGEGDAPTILDKPVQNIFPGTQQDFDLSQTANGGPGGISEDKKSKIQDFDNPTQQTLDTRKQQEADKKKAAEDFKKANDLNKGDPAKDNYKEATDKAANDINKPMVEVISTALWEGVKNFFGISKYVDPDQSQSGEGFNPHAMIDSLLGKGPAVSDKLGIDFELVGRFLGGKVEPKHDAPTEGLVRMEQTGSSAGNSSIGNMEVHAGSTGKSAEQKYDGKLGVAVNILESFFGAFDRDGFNGGIQIPKDGMLDAKALEAILGKFGIEDLHRPDLQIETQKPFFEFRLDPDNSLTLLIGRQDAPVAHSDVPVEENSVSVAGTSSGFANLPDSVRDYW